MPASTWTNAKPCRKRGWRNSGIAGQRLAVVSRHETGADLELADIELAVARHAPVALSRTMAGGKQDLETICFDRVLFERADDLLIADGHGESNFGRHAARSGENGVLRLGLNTHHSNAPSLRFSSLQFPYSFFTKPSFSISSMRLMSKNSSGSLCAASREASTFLIPSSSVRGERGSRLTKNS